MSSFDKAGPGEAEACDHPLGCTEGCGCAIIVVILIGLLKIFFFDPIYLYFTGN